MTNTEENIKKAEEMLEEMAKRLNIQYDEEDGVDYSYLYAPDKKKEIETDIITINCGESLLIYLREKGLLIEKYSGIPGPRNCIYLPDKTSFNWKSSDGVVRVNCKETAKSVLENKSNLKMINNGAGDKSRRFSLIIDNVYDLDLIIEALATIAGNSV